MILTDTSAWMEYFLNGKYGKIVEKYLEEEVITPTIVLAELSIRSEREGWDFNKHLNFIKSKSLVINLNENIIKRLGLIYLKQRKIRSGFSICDAIIYSTALFEKAKILTKDNDFRGLDNVIFLE